MYVDRFRFEPGSEFFQRAELSPWTDFKLHQRLKTVRDLWRNKTVHAGYRALEDRRSRKIFRDILIFRYLSPHLSGIARNGDLWREIERFMASEIPSQPLPEKPDLLGDEMRLWDVSYNDQPSQVITTKYGLYWSLICPQYYFRRGAVYVGPREGDVILDCGAFIGDSAVKFAANVGPSGQVYSFDPVPFHAALAREVVARNGLQQRIEVFTCGVSDENKPNAEAAIAHEPAGEVERMIAPGRRMAVSDATIRIDDFCALKRLDRVDYIKMDIEHSEMKALAGAHQTIVRHRPKLAVCVYHNKPDLWAIPAAVKERYPFYKLYLDHYTLYLEETVLYAIAS